MIRVGGFGAAPAENAPGYLASLESDRSGWWRSDNFDKWKSHYISEYPRGFFIRELLQRYVPGFDAASSRVLDVGCGDGGVVIAFAEAGSVSSGIEPDARSLERARIRAAEHGVEVDFIQGIGEDLPFSDAAFDLVVLDNVLEHVEDRERTLAEIHRVLRPGGVAYIVTPKPFAIASILSDPHYELAGLVLLPRWLQVWYFERLRGGGLGNYGVGRIPTRHRLLRLLRNAGLTPVVPPRDLWIRYLRERVAAPSEIRGDLKGRVAGWAARRNWLFEHAVPRWFWDVALGSNYVIAKRLP